MDLVIHIWSYPLYKSILMYVKYKLYTVKYSIQMLFTVIRAAAVFVLSNLSVDILLICIFYGIPYNMSTNP